MVDKPRIPQVVEFERLVWAEDNKAALKALCVLLDTINGEKGQLEIEKHRNAPAVFRGGALAQEATRICAAIGELFARPAVEIDDLTFRRLIGCHRWMHILFGASSFGNADHILERLGLSGSREAIKKASRDDLIKFCLLYGQDSNVLVDLTALFKRSPALACAFVIALLSSRLVATPAAHQKKEQMLKWLTEALDRLPSMEGLPTEVLIDVFMHCSYADDPLKHDVKKPLNRLLRRHLASLGFTDPPLKASADPRKTVFVMLEWFHKNHSIMRTHSRSLLALKKHYRLVGVGPARMVDETGRAVFDEYHDYPPFDQSFSFVDKVMELTRKHRPVAVYYPSVGMAIHSLVLINFRLAPVQCIALGHPATTHSDKIDYVLVEEDYIGDPALFSEKLVALPKNAIPYLEPKLDHPVPSERKNGGPVRVAIPAALMKLNPRFLLTCRTVQERSSVDVEFHIMAGGDYGFVHDYLDNSVLNLLPGARVHRTVPYPKYMASIAACDVFANPFPFGNTNGIVDTVFCGLPGVCLSGGEVHSHIDEGMFRRMNFPEWMIARTPQEYADALLRLIEDAGLRRDLNARILNERWDRVLYEGRPEAFAEVFCRLVDADTAPSEQSVQR